MFLLVPYSAEAAPQDAVGASYPPPGQPKCPPRPGTRECMSLAHLTGTRGWWPTCCTAMLLNPPVLQEPLHCLELLQLQRIQLVHSLISTHPLRVPKPRRCRRNELSGTAGKGHNVHCGMGNKHFPAHVGKRPMPVAISASCSLSTVLPASQSAALKPPVTSKLSVPCRKQSRRWLYRRQWFWDMVFKSALCYSSHPIAATSHQWLLVDWSQECCSGEKSCVRPAA